MSTDPGEQLPRRSRHNGDTLLASAVQVFLRRGYDGASMEDLAAAAGISKSSIYHHVRGKEDLLRRALTRALDALFATLDETGGGDGPAIERLEQVTRRTTEVLMAELPYVTLLLRVHGNTETERWALQRRREFDRRVAELVAEASAAGDLRSDIDPHLATRLLFGMVNSIGEWYRPRDPRDGEPTADVADAVVGMAFDGLRTRP